MNFTVMEIESPEGEQRWTVVAHEGQYASARFFYGGDHHWVDRDLAELAQLAYKTGAAQHGDPPRSVILAGLRSKLGGSTPEKAERWAAMLTPAEVADIMQDMVENPRSYNWAQHKFVRLRAVLLIRESIQKTEQKVGN